MTVALPVTIPIQQLDLTPGSSVTISNVTWEKFEAILEALGEKRSTRIAYYDGTLEMMSPLPMHERPHRIMGSIVAALLDAEERDWDNFGSTTFRRKVKKSGLEPDTCFYIENAERVRECRLIMDLELYPPPDLAIEADVTSKTTLDAYAGIQVPEVWIYQAGQLTIHLLQADSYAPSLSSPTFPTRPMLQLVPALVQQALAQGSSKMLRDLRNQLAAE